MDTLGSPLEALTLNYLTYGFLTAVNNIWAWFAVVTAAVSFWKIRASSSPPLSTPEFISRSQDATSTSSPPPKVVEPVIVNSTLIVEETHLLSPTKTKFSLYCKEDDSREDDDGEDEDCGGEAAAVLGRPCDDWERMMVMRMGDMGWYRWQDTTVLDGSVVRLWDERRRGRSAAAALVVDGGAW